MARGSPPPHSHALAMMGLPGMLPRMPGFFVPAVEREGENAETRPGWRQNGCETQD